MPSGRGDERRRSERRNAYMPLVLPRKTNPIYRTHTHIRLFAASPRPHRTCVHNFTVLINVSTLLNMKLVIPTVDYFKIDLFGYKSLWKFF